VQRENNCTISLRGVYVEPGKKPPVGCRKLYLHIQSEDKSYVSTAYKDIKRVIEEGAYESMHMSAAGKFAL
jgi:ATP-dependent RNA helicase DDX46/PRP5